MADERAAAVGDGPGPAGTYWTNWFALLMAGLIGGGVVAGLGYYYDASLRQPDARLAVRLDTLEGRLGELGEARAQIQALRERAPSIEATVAELGARLDAGAQDIQALAQRFAAAGTMTDVAERLTQTGETLQRLQDDLANLGQQAAGVAPQLERATADLRQQMAVLGQQLEELQGRVGTLPTSQPDLAPLREELQRAQAAIAELQGALDRRVSSLEQRVAELARTSEQAVADAAATAAAATEKTQQQIASIEQALATLRGQAEVRVSGLERQLHAVRLVGERAASLALALEDAERAIASGAPLEDPLRRLREAAPDDQQVSEATTALGELAARAIPSGEELTRRLEAIRPGQAPAPPPKARVGWLGRAAENLGGVVDVSKADPTTRAAQEAVKRARARLEDGDIAGARDLLAPLARDGNEEAAAWVAAAETRLAAQATLERIRERLQAMLTAAG